MRAREPAVEFAAIVDEWLDVRVAAPGRQALVTPAASVDDDLGRLCEVIESRGALAFVVPSWRPSRLTLAKGRSVVVVHPRRARHRADDRQHLVRAIVDVADAGARLAGVIEIGEVQSLGARRESSREDVDDATAPDDAAAAAAEARIAALAAQGAKRIDELDFDAARTTLAALEVAAVELDRPEPLAATRLALARCLFWQGNMPGSLRLVDLVPGTLCREIRAQALRRRVLTLLALGRTGDAGRLLPDLRDLLTGRCAALWYEASIYWRSASGARWGACAEAGSALRLVRRAPAWQVRIALAWDAACATLGERREPALLERLHRRHGASLSPLLVSRLLLALGRPVRAFRRRPPPGAAILAGKRDVMSVVPEGAALDDVLRVLAIVDGEDDEERAVEAVTSHIRDRMLATGVTMLDARDNQVLLVLGNAGDETRRAAVDSLTKGAPTDVVRLGPARVAAVPILHRGRPVAAFGVRWSGNADFDEKTTIRTLTAIAAASTGVVQVILERREATKQEPSPDSGLVGDGEAMTRLREQIRRAAGAPFHVLVDGESGSGKELVARAMHRLGPRRHRRLCAVNCAALNDELLEAELFGHARGAFTGAVAERAGLFEEADGGTLFLDEIGELSARGQAKVLRAIQEQEVRRVGESHPRRVDVRIIAATNRDLAREAREGRFRDDLRYRLDVVHVRVPPLRERLEDVAMLTGQFWREAAARVGSRARLDTSTLAALARYDWPGNVRELQNVLASLAVSAPRAGRIGPAWLPPAITRSRFGGVSLEQARRRFDADYIRAALARAGGRRLMAARELGVSRQGLAKLMARLGLDAHPAAGSVDPAWTGSAPDRGMARLACDRAASPSFPGGERS